MPSPRRAPRRTLPLVDVPQLGDRLWTVDDAAAFLGVPVGTLNQWRYRGTGPRAYRVGRHLRSDPRDVRQWLDQQAA
jgi:excisionase family DNA binding protein